ncbi:MAG: BMC domain-containing protein [Christensenellales bacterium]
MKALGMIEVYGRIGAIEGLDSALKAANVSLVNMVRVGGGFTSFFIEGDVGAVKAAIDAAETSAGRVGSVVSSHVIPRPDQSVRNLLNMNQQLSPKDQKSTDNKTNKENADNLIESKSISENKSKENSFPPNKVDDDVEKKLDDIVEEKLEDNAAANATKYDKYEALTVVELRKAARDIEALNLTKQEIKFAKKKELLDAIKKAIEK